MNCVWPDRRRSPVTGVTLHAPAPASSTTPIQEGGPSLIIASGDFVKCLDGGHLAFMGRVDHQTGVRGFRVDLGDIEAILTRQPSTRRSPSGGRSRSESAQGIVAFVAGSP